MRLSLTGMQITNLKTGVRRQRIQERTGLSILSIIVLTLLYLLLPFGPAVLSVNVTIWKTADQLGSAYG